MSTTPRTDAELPNGYRFCDAPNANRYINADFARQLETELVAMQKRYADDVAELNARLIQRREDYAAHSVKQAQEMQSLCTQLEFSVPMRDVKPLLEAANQVCESEAEYGLTSLSKALECFHDKHPGI